MNFRGLFNAKTILTKELQRYYLTYSCRDKGVQAFPKDISPKVNVITCLGFELANFEAVVQNFNYTTEPSVDVPLNQII